MSNKCICYIAVLLSLYACSPGYILRYDLAGTSTELRQKINSLYDPYREKSFCVSTSTSQVYNVIEGENTNVDPPICEAGDIMFHVHPFYGDPFPSPADLKIWEEHRLKYGVRIFGLLLGVDQYQIYEWRGIQ